jgi:hypothetical protein
MRIISDFRDYYDSVQGAGQDLQLIYHRRAMEEKLEGYTFPICKKLWRMLEDPLTVEDNVIGFCGKVYPVLEITKERRWPKQDVSAICFNIEQVDTFIEENFKKKQADAYRRPRSGSGRRRAEWPSHYERQHFTTYFTRMAEVQDKYQKLFLDERCPIFVIYPYGWGDKTASIGRTGRYRKYPLLVTNDCLKEFDFVRLFDPYSAFQEIQMFLGGMAFPNNPIPEVSDADMLIAKGFDAKSSFRKPPGKKKRKKNR